MRCNNCGWNNPDGDVRCAKCGAPLLDSPYTVNVPPKFNGFRPSPAARPSASESVFIPDVMRPARREDVLGSLDDIDISRTLLSDSDVVVEHVEMTICHCGYPLSSKSKICPACGRAVNIPDDKPAADVNTRNPEPAVSTPPAYVPGRATPKPASTPAAAAQPQKPEAAPEHAGNAAKPKPAQASSAKPSAKHIAKPEPVPVNKPADSRKPAVDYNATVMGGPVVINENQYFTLRPVAWKNENRDYEPITYSGNETVVLRRSNTDPQNNTITSKEQAVIVCENGQWYIENRSEMRTTYIRVTGHRVPINKGDIIILGNREFVFND